MQDLSQCLSELDAVSAELASTSTEEFVRLQRLLARRAAALQLLDEGEAPPPELAELERAYQAGQLLAERLRLAQASLREQLREMHRVGVTLRALSVETPGESGGAFDLQA